MGEERVGQRHRGEILDRGESQLQRAKIILAVVFPQFVERDLAVLGVGVQVAHAGSAAGRWREKARTRLLGKPLYFRGPLGFLLAQHTVAVAVQELKQAADRLVPHGGKWLAIDQNVQPQDHRSVVAEEDEVLKVLGRLLLLRISGTNLKISSRTKEGGTRDDHNGEDRQPGGRRTPD